MSLQLKPNRTELKKWYQFKADYCRNFDNEDEELKRLAIFVQNLRGIKEHKKGFKKSRVSWETGVNKYSDRTTEEILASCVAPLHYIKTPDELKEKLKYLCLDDEEIDKQWKLYKKAFHRSFANEMEESLRRKILVFSILANVEIDTVKNTWYVEMTETSDYTAKEMESVAKKKKFTMEVELTEEIIAERWEEFKKKFRKNYADAEEESYRKELFVANLKMVEEHNEKYENGLVNYKMTINQFADYTRDEMPSRR